MNELIFDIRSVLTIRLKQICRSLCRSGIIRLTFLSGLFVCVAGYVYSITSEARSSYCVSGICLLIVFYIHLKRSDKLFLRTNIAFYRTVICIEYILLSIPATVCLLLHRQLIAAAILLSGTIIAGGIEITWKRQKKTLNTRIQQYIPADMYEWKAGTRKYFYPLLLCWLCGFGAAFFVAGVPVVIFIIGLLIFEFYAENESLPILLSCEKGAGSLIFHKIKRHTLAFGIIILPLVGVFMIFHAKLWYIPAGEFVLFLAIHLYGIVLKYAFYSLNKSVVNPVFQATGLIVGLIPLTAPVLWALSIYFFKTACINLNTYLNDFNR